MTVVCAEVDRAELGEVFSSDRLEAIEAAARSHGGVIAREHDGRLLVVFSEVAAALTACVEIQRSLGEPPLVRMGLDSGSGRVGTGGVDAALPGAAGLAAAANGGQVLVSARTAAGARRDLPPEVDLLDRGEFALVGLAGPERVFQLRHPDLRASFPPMRASPALSHSLPDARTSFVGREDALSALDELVSRCRLVAVVGPGGAGKTQLALESAARAAPRFSAGAELCDLSPLSDPALVPVTIAVSFGIRESAGVDPLDAIARSISGREALLVIDNCEHLLEAAAAAIDTLLSRARGLRVLATSREPLGVSGEQVWPIGPLRIPGAASSSDEARRAESVLLFEDRARLPAPSFSLDAGNALDVAAICRSLEGFPLAIELVAARVGAMSPDVIAARLRDRSQLLATGPRGGSGRHASLKATIDWSYELLNAPERRLLRTLSVFAGGFSVQAVETMSDAADPLESLAALVDKSLVVWDRDAARYRLLETIRAFARARLEEEGEQDSAARAHLAWSTAFVEPLAELAWSSREPELYAIVDREIDNLRAALSWAAEHGAADGLHLVGKLRDYWFRRAYLEGRRWCRRLLDAVPGADALDVGRALETAAFCAVLLGRDLEQAADEADQAVAVLEGAGDERALPHARLHRAYIRADLEACRTEHLEVRAMAVKAGDPLLEAAALMNLAAKEAELGGDPSFAADCAEQALAILAEIDCPPTAHAAALQMLGSAILDSGRPLSAALGYFSEAQDYVAELRSPGLLADNLFSLATCLVEPDPESAARLLGASLGLLERQGTVLRPPDAAEVERVRCALEDEIGAESVGNLMGSVSRISFDEAVDLGRLAIKTLPVSRS